MFLRFVQFPFVTLVKGDWEQEETSSLNGSRIVRPNPDLILN